MFSVLLARALELSKRLRTHPEEENLVKSKERLTVAFL